MAMAVVLLVDDEIPFVETMTKRLTKRNFTVLSAFGGAEALEKLKQQKNVDVAVLDVKMPGMDGIEVLRVFKKMVPDMPVIMLTGHGTEMAAREGLDMGAFDYLTKPCDLEELVDKIRAACRR